MKLIVIRILGCLLLAGSIISIFLPFLESFVESVIHRPFSIISVRPNPHQGGMFGGGFYTIYNGFGSLNALFNCFISLLLSVSIFRRKAEKIHFRILLTLFISSQAFLFINIFAMPFFLYPPDKLLTGYFSLTTCEIGLLILLHKYATGENKRYRTTNTLLLDENDDH